MDRKSRGGRRRSSDAEGQPSQTIEPANNEYADLANLAGVGDALSQDEIDRSNAMENTGEIKGLPIVSQEGGRRPPELDGATLPELAYPDGTLILPPADETVDPYGPPPTGEPSPGGRYDHLAPATASSSEQTTTGPIPIGEYRLPRTPVAPPVVPSIDELSPEDVAVKSNSSSSSEAAPSRGLFGGYFGATPEGTHADVEEPVVASTIETTPTPAPVDAVAAPAPAPEVSTPSPEVTAARTAVSDAAENPVAVAPEPAPAPIPVAAPETASTLDAPAMSATEAAAWEAVRAATAETPPTPTSSADTDPAVHGHPEVDLTQEHHDEFLRRVEAEYANRAGATPPAEQFGGPERVARQAATAPDVVEPVVPGVDRDLRGPRPDLPSAETVAAENEARRAARTPDVTPTVTIDANQKPAEFGAKLNDKGIWEVPKELVDKGGFKADVAEEYTSFYNSALESDKRADSDVEVVRAKRIAATEEAANKLLTEADELEAKANRAVKTENINAHRSAAEAKRAEAADLQSQALAMQRDNIEGLQEVKDIREAAAERRREYMDKAEEKVGVLNANEIDRTDTTREHDSQVAEAAAYAGDKEASRLMSWAEQLKAEQAAADKLAETDPRYQLDKRFKRESDNRKELIQDISSKANTMMDTAGSEERARLNREQTDYRTRALDLVGQMSALMSGKETDLQRPINGQNDVQAERMVIDVLRSMGYDAASDEHSQVDVKTSLLGKPKYIDRIYSNTTDVDPERRGIMMVGRYDAQSGKLIRFDAVKVPPFKDDYFTVDAEGTVINPRKPNGSYEMSPKQFDKLLKRIDKDTQKWEKKAKKAIKGEYRKYEGENVEYNEKNVDKKPVEKIYGGMLESLGVPKDQAAERAKKAKPRGLGGFWQSIFRPAR